MGKRRAQPSPYTPPIVKPEDVLLYKTANESESIRKDMNLTPEQERRLAKMEEAEQDKQRKYAMKLTTRADVIAILSMYIERNILPYGARLDLMEAYIKFLELPFYMRWWINTVRLWKRTQGAVMGFARRIKFVKIPKGGKDVGSGEAETGTGGAGPEGGGGEDTPDEVRDSVQDQRDEAGGQDISELRGEPATDDSPG